MEEIIERPFDLEDEAPVINEMTYGLVSQLLYSNELIPKFQPIEHEPVRIEFQLPGKFLDISANQATESGSSSDPDSSDTPPEAIYHVVRTIDFSITQMDEADMEDISTPRIEDMGRVKHPQILKTTTDIVEKFLVSCKAMFLHHKYHAEYDHTSGIDFAHGMFYVDGLSDIISVQITDEIETMEEVAHRMEVLRIEDEKRQEDARKERDRLRATGDVPEDRTEADTIDFDFDDMDDMDYSDESE